VLDVGNGFPVAHVQPDWVPQKLRVQVRRPFTVRPSPAQKDAHGKGKSLNFSYIFAPLDKTGQAMNSPVFPVLSKYFFFSSYNEQRSKNRELWTRRWRILANYG
jgi:hypothetical protein